MSPNPTRTLVAVALVAAAATGFWLLLRGAQALPDQPQPVAWDRDSCAHCRMLVGEPDYAAQLITTDGQILNFDDPGCLVKHLEDNQVQVHRMWFHAAGEDAWLAPDEVAFARVPVSPMGYGFAATSRPSAEAVPLAEMKRRVLATREVAQP